MAHKIGILGATGYAGNELVRILSGHPHVELAYLSSETYKGRGASDVYPSLGPNFPLAYRALDIEAVASECELVFIAMPNGEAMKLAPVLLDAECRVVDLGADYRFADPAVYEEWYGMQHLSPHLCSQAVYGLTELSRGKLPGAALVANPGCYPTSVLLPTAALVRLGLIGADGLIVDSKSGVSGAGRSLGLSTHFCEANDSIAAYKIGVHRHTPEIETQLEAAGRTACRISFTPHLTPMNRGILSTIYVGVETRDEAEVFAALKEFYRDEPFVRVRPAGNYPATREVFGSNFCDIGLRLDERTGRLVVVSVIDNLVKGAAGQAVQNMNLMLGLPETSGLQMLPLYP